MTSVAAFQALEDRFNDVLAERYPYEPGAKDCGPEQRCT